jgi:hypothetical protein
MNESETEKPVIALMVLLLVVALGTAAERIAFVARSEPTTAQVFGATQTAVELPGTLRDPRSHEVDTTEIRVMFRDRGGGFHIETLAYFFAPPDTSVAARHRMDDPSDVRRAGLDLFAIPILLLLAALALEPVRRWTRRRARSIGE